MAKYSLKIRRVDKIVFDAIKNGSKKIETRAATDKYRKIKTGDVLVFICENDKLEKKVKRVERYKSIDELMETIDFKDIMPFADSIDEVEKIYFSFPGYKEKIKKLGLVSFELE